MQLETHSKTGQTLGNGLGQCAVVFRQVDMRHLAKPVIAENFDA